jgi:hypothetical protein
MLRLIDALILAILVAGCAASVSDPNPYAETTATLKLSVTQRFSAPSESLELVSAPAPSVSRSESIW